MSQHLGFSAILRKHKVVGLLGNYCSQATTFHHVLALRIQVSRASDKLRRKRPGERKYGLVIDALATICSWNPNASKVWSWRLW